jgi:hypothetical protein
MEGPYDFTAAAVDGSVEGNRIGNYALGSADKQGSLTVGYVGRSDRDLRAEIKSYLGKKRYPHFKFSYATSATEAYLKECQNFHDFKMEERGQIHPAKPRESGIICPVCGA